MSPRNSFGKPFTPVLRSSLELDNMSREGVNVPRVN